MEELEIIQKIRGSYQNIFNITLNVIVVVDTLIQHGYYFQHTLLLLLLSLTLESVIHDLFNASCKSEDI